MITESAAFPKMNEARLATRRMMTSGLRNRTSSSRTDTPRLTGVGSFRPYCDRRAAASCEDSPCNVVDGPSTCVGILGNEVTLRKKKCYITSVRKGQKNSLVRVAGSISRHIPRRLVGRWPGGIDNRKRSSSSLLRSGFQVVIYDMAFIALNAGSIFYY
jgi:hypothetical protein